MLQRARAHTPNHQPPLGQLQVAVHAAAALDELLRAAEAFVNWEERGVVVFSSCCARARV